MNRFLTLCLVTALTACATIPAPQPPNAQSQALWQQQLETLKPLSHWSIRGRVAIYVKEDVYNLGMSWQREDNNSTLKLEASLGQGLIMLTRNANRIELTTAEGESVHGNNAQQLLYDTTGLLIPVEGLQTWIKGIPHEQSDFQHAIDAEGRTQSLQQDGWKINYLKYSDSALPQIDRASLPRKLYMKHDGLALKIVIDQWQNDAQPPQSDLFPTFPD